MVALSFHPRSRFAHGGFTLMEALVAVAILLVVAAIILPIYSSLRGRSDRVVAMDNMRTLTTAMLTYAEQHNGELPQENVGSGETWAGAATPAAESVWYNALPRMVGKKGVGDFVNAPQDFYSKDSMLYLPGAQYPVATKKLVRPLFAFAINTKLQRKDASGNKVRAKLSQIALPARTVAFLEEGLPGEAKASPVQAKYEGDCKSAGRSFVERYNGQGVITFLDGHAESVSVKDLLTETGRLFYPQTNIVWTRTPDEDPNPESSSK
jgi:prepilin-type N-terminal cleavage/methylation domain-containing protein/prepilin-type processing-associated H-X9-DG protein